MDLLCKEPTGFGSNKNRLDSAPLSDGITEPYNDGEQNVGPTAMIGNIAMPIWLSCVSDCSED